MDQKQREAEQERLKHLAEALVWQHIPCHMDLTTTTYSKARVDLHCAKFYGNFKYLVFRAAILALCYKFATDGLDHGNIYTKNHYEFNKLILTYGIKYYALVILGDASMQNFGIRTKLVYIDSLVLFFGASLRILLAICMIQTTYFDLFQGLAVCWTLNTDNWWID